MSRMVDDASSMSVRILRPLRYSFSVTSVEPPPSLAARPTTAFMAPPKLIFMWDV